MSLTWFAGQVHEGSRLSFDLRDRGITLGDGLFETLLVVNCVPLWREQHLRRLSASSQVLGLNYPAAEIAGAIAALLRSAPAASQVMRISLSRGVTARGLANDSGTPTLIVTFDPFNPSLIGAPAMLATSVIRRSFTAPSSRHKTLSYIDAVAAAREADAAGADDALMLNDDGNVASTTIANIFLLLGDQLITPSRDQGILPGIMRQAVIDGASALGMAVEERAVKVSELAEAEAVFLTNSLRFLRPVLAVDGQGLGKRDPLPILQSLLAQAEAQCGRNPLSVGFDQPLTR